MAARSEPARVVRLVPRDARPPQVDVDFLLWAGVDRVMDHAPELSDLASHRVESLAARRFRALGRPVPAEFRAEERAAAISSLVAPRLLARVREACDGPILVIKGPEVAARYPDPALRPFKDLDLLVPRAEKAQEALLAAGFEPIGDPALYVDIHHLRPLAVRGLPISVEVHSQPKWLEQRRPPSTDELLASAIPSATGVDGVLAPGPVHHALLLAAHSWAHEPLRRLRDLVDVAAMIQGLDRAELGRIARVWQVARLWETTTATLDALFFDERVPWALRVWARNLLKVRERTVLENHLERLLSNFWSLSARESAAALGPLVAEEVRPKAGETWGEKLGRSSQAVRNALRRRSEHDAALERRASR
jgi:hypothetical protein